MRTVVVTGGTVRLGRAIAEALRCAGWRVLVTSHRAEAGADFVADLTDPQGPARLYAAVLDRLGGQPPDGWVNNAALFTGEAEILRRLNAEAPEKFTMLMAGRETGIGAIVNVLDCQALGEPTPVDTPYLASKRALRESMMRVACLFAATLRVNAVAPGPVLAPSAVHVCAGEMLLDRRPTPADVAAAVVYLLEAEAVTGAILPVDAGQHLLP